MSLSIKELMKFQELIEEFFPLSEEELKKRQQYIDEINEMKERLIDRMSKDYLSGEIPRIRSRDEIRKEIDDHHAKCMAMSRVININALEPEAKKAAERFFEVFGKSNKT